MKRLILPSGHVCLLDDEDFAEQGWRSWYLKLPFRPTNQDYKTE